MESVSNADNANQQAYRRARDSGHTDYMDQARKQNRFYWGGGDQWDEADKAKMRGLKRPMLETNLILSTINDMLGEHSAQQVNITYSPKRNGATADLADVLSQVALHIQNECNYDYIESQVYADGLIEDRGYFDVRMDFDENIAGEVCIKHVDPSTVLLPPGAKEYDPGTWPEIIVSPWMTLDEIESNYGKEKRQELEAYASSGDSYGADYMRFDEQTFGDTNTHTAEDADIRSIRKVRVIDRQYRKLAMQSFFVDRIDGDMRAVPKDWPPEKVTAFAKANNLAIMRKVVNKIRWVVSADHVVLHDEWSPYTRFTLIPFFPYFRRGKPFGVVRNLISPQEQLNKVDSQELHIVNSTANSGWAVEQNSLVGMTIDDLEERGAETGLVIEYRKGHTAPEKIKPNTIPTGLDLVARKSADAIQKISGITPGMGNGPSDMSGKALNARRFSGKLLSNVPESNLAFSRKLVAEFMLELIQTYYTETRVLRVTKRNQLQQDQEEITINGVTIEGAIFNDLTLGEYDVEVSSIPSHGTFLDTQFNMALDMRQVGVMIPDEHIILSSNLKGKNDIAKEVQQLQGRGPLTPEQQQMQQMMQELEIRRAMAEVSAAERQVEKLVADTELATAKATQINGQPDAEAEKAGIEAQTQLQKIKADLAKTMMNLQNKLQLAQMHVSAKDNLTMYTTTAKRAMEEFKLNKMADKPSPKGKQGTSSPSGR